MERAWEAADRSQNVFLGFEAVWYRNLRTWLGDPRDAQVWYRRELARPRLSQAPHHRRILLGLLA